MYLGLNSKTIFTVIMCIFLVSTVAAFEFDNVKQYDEDTRTATIKNSILGIPTTTVATIQLLSDDFVYVPAGKDVLVAQFKINNLDGDYSNFLKNMEFYDIVGSDLKERNNLQGVNYKKLVTTGTEVVSDYEWQCAQKEDETKADKMSIPGCTYVEIGNHIEDITEWQSFDERAILRNGEVTLGIFVDVTAGDTVEWIPTLFGERIIEWAGFGAEIVDSHGESLVDDGARSIFEGVGLEAKSNLTITSVGRAGGSLGAAPSVVILDSARQTIAIANFSSVTSQATFPEGMVNITNGSTFYLAVGEKVGGDTWTGTYDPLYRATGVSFDVIGTNVNWTSSLDNWAGNGTIGTIVSGNLNGISNITTAIQGGIPSGTVGITLTLPANNTQQTSAGATFNSTLVATNINQTNLTLFLYFQNHTLADSNFSLYNGNNFSSIPLTGIGVNSYFWTYMSCGLNGSGGTECFFPSVNNFTFTRSVIESQTVNYSQSTIEGSTENFFLNLTFNSSAFALNSAIFNYNNTQSTSIIGGTGDNRLITSSITVPSVNSNVNKTFLWELSLTDLSNSQTVLSNTSINNQSVLNLAVDNCTAFTTPLFNFTVVDEELQTFIINATIETAINIFDRDRSELVANVSNSFNNPVSICINVNLTNTTVFSLDTIVRYEAVETHANEYFNIVNTTLNINFTEQNITLFDLNLSDSTEFQLTFAGSDFLPVENALVFVDRQYIAENTFKTVELPLTDANGQTILHLVRNDVIYNLRMIKNGIVLGNFENIIAFCEDFAIGDCKIILDAGESTEALFNYDNVLGITFTTPTFDNDTRLVTFDFLTTDGTSKTVLMNVTRADIFGNRTICEDTLVSSGGTLSCSVPTNIDDADLRISVFVDDVQTVFKVIKLDLTDFGVAGYLVFFVLSLTLILLFSSSKTGILVAILLSFAVGIGLSMVTSSLIGLGASGLWLVIIVLIGIWKLNKDRIQ